MCQLKPNFQSLGTFVLKCVKENCEEQKLMKILKL